MAIIRTLLMPVLIAVLTMGTMGCDRPSPATTSWMLGGWTVESDAHNDSDVQMQFGAGNRAVLMVKKGLEDVVRTTYIFSVEPAATAAPAEGDAAPPAATGGTLVLRAINAKGQAGRAMTYTLSDLTANTFTATGPKGKTYAYARVDIKAAL